LQLDPYDAIIDFIQKYAPHHFDRTKIKEYIQLHFKYKTAFVVFDDNKEIIAICRWNLLENDTKAKILDFIIREDAREKWGNKIFSQLLRKGLWIFPNVKEIGWERSRRTKDRGLRFYKVEQVLKRR